MAKPIRAGVAVDTSGLSEVSKVSQQRTMTLKSVRAAGKVVAAAAKARAPKRKGKGGGGLRAAMGVKASKGKRGKTLSLAVVGARKKVVRMVPNGKAGKPRKHVPAFIAHIVEGGAKSHRLNGGTHPGARAKPFLGPAFDASADKAGAVAEQVLGQEVRKLLDKAAAKAASKRKA